MAVHANADLRLEQSSCAFVVSFPAVAPRSNYASALGRRLAAACLRGEGTLLAVMLRDCALERGMAEGDAAEGDAVEGDAVEVKGRFNATTRIAMWLKGAVVDVGLDAASVDVLCMVLDRPGLRQGRLDLPAAALAKGAPRHCTTQAGETPPPALVLRRQDQGLPPASSGSAQKSCSEKWLQADRCYLNAHYQPLLGTVAADKAFKLINSILPDFVIDARGERFSELLSSNRANKKP